MLRRSILIVALFGAACTMRLQEDKLFNAGPPLAAADTSKWTLPAGAQAADVTLTMADGTRLHAVRLTKEGATADVLYLGGNMFRTEQHGAQIAAALAGENANALLVDYRGYGRSEGKPTVAALQSDAIASYDWLRAQTQLPIVVHGFSLGSFMAANVAAQRHPQALVLESTATSVTDWVASQSPFFVNVKISDDMRAQDNVARLKIYRGPLLIVAGDADKVTPLSLSKKLLAAAASTDKQLLVAPGANHGAALEDADSLAAYGKFLAKLK